MDRFQLQGSFTALITPFNRDGSVDIGALRALVDRQIAAGIDGLTPMGTTGESPTLNHREHIEVIRIVVAQAGGRVPVLAGAGSNSTEEALDMARHAMDVGADATLQVTPYYNKPNQEGLYRHFSTIAAGVELPLVLYNIPGRSARAIETATMLRLAAHERIVGVKEASESIPQAMALLRVAPPDFALISGADQLALPLMQLGGTGVISVASNLIPKRIAEMVAIARRGEFEEARRLHWELLPLMDALFIDTNPIPIKYALSLLGQTEEYYRLPLCPMSEAAKDKLRQVMQELHLL